MMSVFKRDFVTAVPGIDQEVLKIWVDVPTVSLVYSTYICVN